MNFLNKNYNSNNGSVDINEEMVDIQSGKAEKQNVNKNRHMQSSRASSKKNTEYDDNYGAAKFNNAGSKNNKNNNEKNNKKKKIILISSIAAAVVVALGITGFCLLQNGGINIGNETKEFTFAEGTVVSGVSISGKTVKEAKALLESKEADFIKPVSITVNANGEQTILTESNFKYTYDIDAVLGSIQTEATNPSADKTSETKTYEITATPTEDSIVGTVKEIKEKTDKKATNASVSKFTPYSSKNRFEYEKAQQGCTLDDTDLTEQVTSILGSGLSSGSINAVVETVDADISIDDIKKNVKKLASYETVSYNTADGTTNMKVALEACNGSVIEPDGTWSFNKCTGDSNLESNGYKPAHVISEGELIDGIGGGICQASSTIYNAAIRANMSVEERTCHMWASSYVPTGLDATIDYPRLDLKLSNPTDYQMFMECKLVDRTLYVSIWGYKDSSYDTIKTDNELVSQGESSYTVKAWRVYYKDGKEVDRESLGSSTYDSDQGYLFINADNDTNDDVGNVDDVTEPTKKNESSSTNYSSSSKPSSSSSSSSHSSSSSQSSVKPTEAPKPTEKVTDPPATTPQTSGVESENESDE